MRKSDAIHVLNEANKFIAENKLQEAQILLLTGIFTLLSDVHCAEGREGE